jgi:MFS family permease
VESKTLIGAIMTFDNILAIFLIPIFSALSDRVRTPIGRRMPFIVVCLPVSAVAFGLIPFSALSSLWFLIILLFILNLFKQAVRGPVVALMPDMIPADLRSEANGVINTMGGIAAIVGTVGLARLMDVPINLPGRGPTKDILAFPISGILVIIATLLLFFFVKEKNAVAHDESERREPILSSLKAVFAEEDKSARAIRESCRLSAYTPPRSLRPHRELRRSQREWSASLMRSLQSPRESSPTGSVERRRSASPLGC